MECKKKIHHKNWPEICRLPDTNMRIIISLSQESTVLSKLTEMFPACFTTRKTRLVVPQSAIMWASRQYAIEQNFNPVYQDFYSKFMWHHACTALGMQVERFRRPNGINMTDGPSVYQQLHGQIPTPGMEVIWHGKPHMVIQIEIRPEDTNKPIPKTFQPTNLLMVPAENIDRNS